MNDDRNIDSLPHSFLITDPEGVVTSVNWMVDEEGWKANLFRPLPPPVNRNDEGNIDNIPHSFNFTDPEGVVTFVNWTIDEEGWKASLFRPLSPS